MAETSNAVVPTNEGKNKYVKYAIITVVVVLAAYFTLKLLR